MSSLSEGFSRLVKRLKGQARMTPENIEETLRELRLSLLEADVALPVVRELLESVKTQALGQAVQQSLTPGQAFITAVQREIIARLQATPEQQGLKLNVQPPAVILLAGLQGSGKTTSAGKLAHYLKKREQKKTLLFSADIYRAAAMEQLRLMSEQAGTTYFPAPAGAAPIAIARAALDYARGHLFDVVIADSAGRTGLDEAMLQEIAALHEALKPVETLFVCDAMTGQTALQTARAFAERVKLTGIVLTKTDGDARGGAALSALSVSGAPVKFLGVSEKINGLERFDAERFAARILGMGDMLALIEQAQEHGDVKAAERALQSLKDNRFDLNNLLEQIRQMRKMGGLDAMAKALPDALAAKLRQAQSGGLGMDARALARNEGIICAMTQAERRAPDLLKASRKRRIAAGSGTSAQEVNRLLNQFEQMQGMMKKMKGGRGLMGGLMQKLGGGLGMPSDMAGMSAALGDLGKLDAATLKRLQAEMSRTGKR